jgi:hypothetical protein
MAEYHSGNVESVRELSQVIIGFIDHLRAERRLYPELYAEDLAVTILEDLDNK